MMCKYGKFECFFFYEIKRLLGFEPGATIPDPARPQVADRGTALRYGG